MNANKTVMRHYQTYKLGIIGIITQIINSLEAISLYEHKACISTVNTVDKLQGICNRTRNPSEKCNKKS
jgi:hypothetical protein